MKKVYQKGLLFLLLLSFILVCCSKDSSVVPATITGQWKWIATYKDYPRGPTNPLTPLNTGIHETLIFDANNNWTLLRNDTIINNGTYTIGHGTYTNLSHAIFIYDSIKYYKNSTPIIGGVDYYKIYHDSLSFNPGLSGNWVSYSVSYVGGSKWYLKQ